MSRTGNTGTNARDRLLLAAAQLLAESGNRTLSTRAVCQLAGVQAPTLYHHFASKQGLIDAVINYGFTQYVQSVPDCGSDDPLANIRQGWDRHVQFGLEHPTFYALLYGQIEPGRPCAITAPAQAMLEELLSVAARQRLLKVAPADAAAQLLAANVGVTLSLITQPLDALDLTLSERVREAALAGVLARPHAARGKRAKPVPLSRASAAVALRAHLHSDASGLSPGEAVLLGELLDRVSVSDRGRMEGRECGTIPPRRRRPTGRSVAGPGGSA
jgi:AcrR family transcriptional regulator